MDDLRDRLAIRELHEAYCDAVARRDAAAWAACWTEDAVWVLMGTRVEGRAAMVALWEQAMAGFEAVSLIAVPAMIAVRGDRATGRTQTHEVLRTIGGQHRVVAGLYEDHMVRDDGGWRYSARDFRLVVEYPGADT